MNLMEENKKKKNIINVNDQLIIISDDHQNNDDEKNYYVSLVIRDKNNIKHCVKISAELMKNNQPKIPSEITVETSIINKKDSRHLLLIKQVCDTIVLIYDGFFIANNRFDAKDIDSNKLISIIKDFLNSFSDLKDDINLNTGLERINPSLNIVIKYILDFWNKFDIDSYIAQQEEMIQEYKSDYLKKVAPIQRQISQLKLIQEANNKTKKK